MTKALSGSSFLGGGSAAYLEAQYENWLRDPGSVPENLRTCFEELPAVNGAVPEIPHSQIRAEFARHARNRRRTLNGSGAGLAANLAHERKQVGVGQLVNAYRTRGHQRARVNPLHSADAERHPVLELELATHGLTEADLDTRFYTGSLHAPEQLSLREIRDQLEATYCGAIGIEYTHVLNTTQKAWLEQRVESARGTPTYEPQTRRWLLERLTAAEGIEKYLHTKYVGQKRFSLEGGEGLIPLLTSLVQRSGRRGIKEIVVGMAHRGRLNVLVNILGKRPAELFSEFEGKRAESLSSGDVKYHQGFSSDIATDGGHLHLALAFNPSHLEIVSPVVGGSVRSRQDRRKKQGDEVLAISIHGDAAFAGQGVVMETFNMAYVRGYSTHGTVRIVINNQVGFTTSNPLDNRSTVYCTDVAKMINSPILHVNGDDPEAVLFAAQLALDYRMEFRKDFIIDLTCYRRHGHNEADEPSATQPLMYQKIKALPTTRKLYADRLVRDGVLAAEDPEQMAAQFRDHLDAGDCVAPGVLPGPPADTAAEKRPENPHAVDWSKYANRQWRDPWEPAVPLEHLQALANRLTSLPDGLELHPRVRKIVEDRRKMTAGALPLDWGYAENLAYASLLDAGYGVRLSGQDCGRGTFFHRHAVLHNQHNGESYVPLENLAPDQPEFRVIDSVLSEAAPLAFEYGYATNDPEKLVIWEAQFGDFANGAQVVIDQFISSGEAKWGRFCGLVLLLPHGYEGQGPEHSSARLERFMQLCAQDNMQLVVPSTPAQCYHMLRRQMLRPLRQPLVVMSPKSLLRHKLAISTLEDLSEGTFMPVLGEQDPIDPAAVRKLVLCGGKVYYDLLEKRRAESIADIALVRLEQLYPFPYEEMNAITRRYSKARDIVWCQEEPRNQGAWFSSRHRIERCLNKGQTIRYAGREPSASPAIGYANAHSSEQALLVEQALGLAD
ncbi:MAG: 2-oxoglutarate dehydrogenase E1 component [Cellvibrionales bacterium]|nr:2-oxoglutarate dehydrogenase E1 component [Cellvibrionales bacterium]